MTRIIILNTLLGIFLLCSLPVCAKADVIKSAYSRQRESALIMQLLPDTIPASVKPVEGADPKPETVKPVTAVIKEVPKARKVAVPKPVTVKVKPVKIIKPKIIKPVIKVL